MTQMIMINYDFINENHNYQRYQRSIFYVSLFIKKLQPIWKQRKQQEMI